VETPRGEPPAAPNPVTGDWVDNQADYEAVNAIGQKFCSLSHSAGDYSRGRRAENRLKDGEGIGWKRRIIIASNEKINFSDNAAYIRAEHDTETQNPERYRTYAEIHQIFHDDVAGVLGPGETRLNHRETRLHKKNQYRPQKNPNCVDR
jgi:hypothetical protein